MANCRYQGAWRHSVLVVAVDELAGDWLLRVSVWPWAPGRDVMLCMVQCSKYSTAPGGPQSAAVVRRSDWQRIMYMMISLCHGLAYRILGAAFLFPSRTNGRQSILALGTGTTAAGVWGKNLQARRVPLPCANELPAYSSLSSTRSDRPIACQPSPPTRTKIHRARAKMSLRGSLSSSKRSKFPRLRVLGEVCAY